MIKDKKVLIKEEKKTEKRIMLAIIKFTSLTAVALVIPLIIFRLANWM